MLNQFVAYRAPDWAHSSVALFVCYYVTYSVVITLKNGCRFAAGGRELEFSDCIVYAILIGF